MTHWRQRTIREFRPNWTVIGILAGLVGCWSVAFYLALELFHWAGRFA